MRIVNATRLSLNIPFYSNRVIRAMHRAGTHGERIYVYRVETDNGFVGYGDHTGVHNVSELIGKNPFTVMNDDSIGYGPQMAVLDAAGKAAGVPVHALLGSRVRSRCPVSWWAIDMPPRDWAAEARESVRRGYTCFKIKARPWRDIFAQIEAVGKAVPADYKLDVDFNGYLLTSPKAEVALRELDKHPNVGMYETPFHLNRDLIGARILREKISKPVIEHFEEQLLHAHACDGFVVDGCASQLRHINALTAGFDKPYWLQLVGSGITTAYATHLGSILSHAQLPYITCHELWEHDLLKKRLKVENGYIEVPDKPGLGIEVDEKAIDKYTVDPDEPTPKTRYLQRKRLLRINWPGLGKKKRVWEFTNEAAYRKEFYAGNIPGFERGVSLEIVEDDGSSSFKKQHQRIAAKGM